MAPKAVAALNSAKKKNMAGAHFINFSALPELIFFAPFLPINASNETEEPLINFQPVDHLVKVVLLFLTTIRGLASAFLFFDLFFPLEKLFFPLEKLFKSFKVNVRRLRLQGHGCDTFQVAFV